MSKGSDSGWGGTPKEKRGCPGCGEKLTLKSAPLWVAGDQPWHFSCRIDALYEEVVNAYYAENERRAA